jgi:hypothetical protein
VRRLAAAFAGALKPHFVFEVGVRDRMMARPAEPTVILIGDW